MLPFDHDSVKTLASLTAGGEAEPLDLVYFDSDLVASLRR